MTNILWSLLIGGCAGWLAGKLTKGAGYGVFGNIGLGIVGGFLGGFLFGLIGFAAYGLIARLVVSTVGAMVLVWIVNQIKK